MAGVKREWNYVERKGLANPFLRTGTDDLHRIGADLPIASVGIVRHAELAMAPRGTMNLARSIHLLLSAPYGAGKSSAIRQLARLCLEASGMSLVVKLEKASLQATLAGDGAAACASEIIKLVVSAAATQLAKKRANANLPFDEAEHEFEAELQAVLDNQPVERLIALIAKHLHRQHRTDAVLLLDESEALLAHESAPLMRRVQLLELFKNWCEETDEHLSIVIAGTTAVEDLIRERVPKVMDRMLPISQFNLDPDSVEEYLEEKVTYAGKHGHLRKLLDDDAISWVTSASRGVPRAIEKLCFAAWEDAQDSRMQLGIEQLRFAVNSLAANHVLGEIAQVELPNAERRAVRRLARSGMSTKTCRERLTDRDMRALARLHKRALLEPLLQRPTRGTYEISDRLLREALRSVS